MPGCHCHCFGCALRSVSSIAGHINHHHLKQHADASASDVVGGAALRRVYVELRHFARPWYCHLVGLWRTAIPRSASVRRRLGRCIARGGASGSARSAVPTSTAPQEARRPDDHCHRNGFRLRVPHGAAARQAGRGRDSGEPFDSAVGRVRGSHACRGQRHAAGAGNNARARARVGGQRGHLRRRHPGRVPAHRRLHHERRDGGLCRPRCDAVPRRQHEQVRVLYRRQRSEQRRGRHEAARGAQEEPRPRRLGLVDRTRRCRSLSADGAEGASHAAPSAPVLLRRARWRLRLVARGRKDDANIHLLLRQVHHGLLCRLS
mmetsp:Transcript_3655/g.11455  ORF Transcript_3655/g.11455 Transcript_3655/m.11455 type:complete len:319 (-) Transcript_3655:441-1397(-)